MLDQINQNLYFGCFEILSLCFGILFLFPIIVLGVLFSFILLFWDIISFSHYCFGVLFSFLLWFWDIILFPIIPILCLQYK